MCVCVCVYVFFQSSHRSDPSKLIELVVFFSFFLFGGRGKGLPRSFVGRVRCLGLVVYSLHLPSALLRIDGFLLRGGRIVFFMFAMAKKVRSKAVEHLSLRGPMLSARFGHGSAFRSGGRGFFFFFFLGREESLFLSFSSFWAGRALVRIRGCFFLYALESENCSYIIYT